MIADLGHWLDVQAPTLDTAFIAHFRLTAIHPFGDGNGRCARLLMNLVLLRGGYPPVAVGPVDRARYLVALEHASLTDDLGDFEKFLAERLNETLGEYLSALDDARAYLICGAPIASPLPSFEFHMP